MKKLGIILLILGAVYFGATRGGLLPVGKPLSTNITPASALTNHTSGEHVQGEGQVIRILTDDNEGSRHQRFIIRLSNGQTLLIAHNIDLAKRIDALRIGDRVAFCGDYEWNAKGGVIHWTHHDPAGRHAGGWLKHNGQTYQ